MLFNIITFVLFAAIAYFHYAQGLFSAMLSALLCVVASVLAIGYHELITPYLMKLPEEANAIAILALFIVSYVVMRLLMDTLVPGNVRFPLLMDKIGAGAMGVVAGLFASGVFAVAAESMPFGPAIGGYTRQNLQDVANVTVPGSSTSSGRNVDTSITDEMVGEKFPDPSAAGGLWLHQDDLVIGFARQMSDAGSALSNDRPLESVHPDYLTELFGQRLGIPVGAKRLAVSGDSVKTPSAYWLAKAPPSMDDEIPAVRGELATPDVPSPGESTLAVVRMVISANPDMTDPDGLLRFSPASVRVKAGINNYYPVGTMVGGVLLMKDRADDPLMIDTKKGPQTVDFLFVISNDDLTQKTEGKERTIKFKDGTFFEFKRYARQDLSGMTLASEHPPTTVEAGTDGIVGGVLRKTSVAEEAIKKATGAALILSAPREKPARGTGDNPSKNNSQDLLPDLPNHAIGL